MRVWPLLYLDHSSLFSLKQIYRIFFPGEASSQPEKSVIKLHEKLLFEMQRNGYLTEFYYKSIHVAENPHETNVFKRISAGFWSDKILEGYEIMQKNTIDDRIPSYKSKHELMTIEEKKYKETVKHHKLNGIDIDNSIILQNFLFFQIQLDMSEEFAAIRIEKMTEYSMKFVKRLLTMSMEFHPDRKKQYEKTINLIDVVKSSSSSCIQSCKSKIFTLEDDLLPLLNDNKRQKFDDSTVENIGIFKLDREKNINWSKVPLGTVFDDNSSKNI